MDNVAGTSQSETSSSISPYLHMAPKSPTGQQIREMFNRRYELRAQAGVNNSEAISASQNSTQKKYSVDEAKQLTHNILSSDSLTLESLLALQKIRQQTDTPVVKISPWDQQLKDAKARASHVIGDVMSANAKYHIIDLMDPANDPYGIYNAWIKIDNDRAETSSFYGVVNMGNALSHAGVGNVISQKENGEYKLHGFQITSNDGKLVSELTEDGRYIEYNEDGSVRNTLSRAETSQLPQDYSEYGASTNYAFMALKNPDKYKDAEFF